MRFTTCLTLLLFVLAAAIAARAEDRFFDSDGVCIRYIERGQGEPVVLIHGFSRNVELTWIDSGIIDALSDDYRVIALDCRGHGKSEKPRGDEAYGAQMAEDVIRLLDHLKIERATLVGYSMGGRIALKLAAGCPHRVRSVVLLGAGGAREDDDHSLWDNVAQALDQRDGIRPLLHAILPNLPEEQIRAINEQTLAANHPEALACVARRYREFATSDQEIEKIQAPVLAIIGTQDAFRPEVDNLKRRMPQLRVITIDAVDHVGLLHLPQTQRTIRQFLDE